MTTLITIGVFLSFLQPSTSGHPSSGWVVPPVFAEVSKSEKYSLQAGGFVSSSGATESATVKLATSAVGDFAATESSVSGGAGGEAGSVVKPGLVQVLVQEAVDAGYPFDIKEIFAKESSGGGGIQAVTWQRDNDPYFYWTIFGPKEGVSGYSFALNETPDETLDVSDSSFSYSEDDISDGKHVFYVAAQSTAGKWGRKGAFEIWVDTTPPFIASFSPQNNVLLNHPAPQFQIDLRDEASGVNPSSIVLKVNGSQANITFDEDLSRVTYTPLSSLKEGSNSAAFDVADKAANITATLVWSFRIDTIPPQGGILINNGDSSTTSISVKLDLEGEDATTSVKEMAISNREDFSGSGWETFNTLKNSWPLDPVTGEQTVYVKFKDEAGNESPVYTDSIQLIIIAPDTFITSGPSGVTDSTQATFTYSASESGSSFRYQIDGGEWADWTAETLIAFETVKPGNHYFSVRAGKDVDGSGSIDSDEEDPTPATRSWSVSQTGGTEAIDLPPEKPVKYWYKE